MMELRWYKDEDDNKFSLQFREKEGPRGEDWWGEWQNIPFVIGGYKKEE